MHQVNSKHTGLKLRHIYYICCLDLAKLYRNTRTIQYYADRGFPRNSMQLAFCIIKCLTCLISVGCVLRGMCVTRLARIHATITSTNVSRFCSVVDSVLDFCALPNRDIIDFHKEHLSNRKRMGSNPSHTMFFFWKQEISKFMRQQFNRHFIIYHTSLLRESALSPQ